MVLPSPAPRENQSIFAELLSLLLFILWRRADAGGEDTRGGDR